MLLNIIEHRWKKYKGRNLHLPGQHFCRLNVGWMECKQKLYFFFISGRWKRLKLKICYISVPFPPFSICHAIILHAVIKWGMFLNAELSRKWHSKMSLQMPSTNLVRLPLNFFCLEYYRFVGMFCWFVAMLQYLLYLQLNINLRAGPAVLKKKGTAQQWTKNCHGNNNNNVSDLFLELILFMSGPASRVPLYLRLYKTF